MSKHGLVSLSSSALFSLSSLSLSTSLSRPSSRGQLLSPLQVLDESRPRSGRRDFAGE